MDPQQISVSGPCSAWARTQHFSPFIPMNSLTQSHLLKNKNPTHRNPPFLHGPGSIITSSTRCGADERGVYGPRLLSGWQQFHCGKFIELSEVLPIPAPNQLLWTCLGLRNQILTSHSHHALDTVCPLDCLLSAFFPSSQAPWEVQTLIPIFQMWKLSWKHACFA